MKINKYKTVFWDFDGVIKDSVPVKTKAFLKLFEEHGEKIAKRIKEHHELHGGVSRYVKIPYYYKEFLNIEISEDFKQKQFAEYKQLVFENVIQSDWIGGVKNYLLNHCNEQKFYIVTGTPEEEIIQILKALRIDDCFEGIFGAPAIKTEVINKILRDEQINKVDSLMIGDALTDYHAAMDNNISFLLRETDESRLHFKEINCSRVENFFDQ